MNCRPSPLETGQWCGGFERAGRKSTAPLGGSQGRFRAGGNHAGLKLGHRGHLLQQELARSAVDCRQVGEAHVHTGLKQARQEGNGARVSRSTLATTSGIADRDHVPFLEKWGGSLGGPAKMAATNKSLAQMNKSGDGI
jgi:hypothetical protein